MDRLTKSACFIYVKSSYSSDYYTMIFIDEVVYRHGTLLYIISDRGSQFTSRFWRSLLRGLGSKINLSTTFHPQTDGQVECTIQTLKDMLRACIIDFNRNWDTNLPLMEFSYNNSYHSSKSMSPYEALYGRRCRSPIGWFEVG